MDDDSSDELSVNDKLRQLTDENSRLYKLLAEKDLEIKRIQNKFENEKTLSSINLNSGDAAAMKIIELSKKIREQTSEIEVERNKVRQLQKKCSEHERQMQSNKKEFLSPEIEKTELELKVNVYLKFNFNF
ncbi:hypothetical protein HELRODRAFT_176741 [Helobdella robusta]|uniref:Janus kinase and microtubule-interacting protein C-terminal domain-containing protein n=1 Tax=Helobdella robusta TaxID=6412 RepID=T1FAV2_HELRO|nr:hypothetical protein HELRODRAFT_176741 [Helobdella robusta]ESN99573.1 hypothetical protein HELRODRAFT_176741 [Helobdella robusta]